jgi:hypothetical protein
MLILKVLSVRGLEATLGIDGYHRKKTLATGGGVIEEHITDVQNIKQHIVCERRVKYGNGARGRHRERGRGLSRVNSAAQGIGRNFSLKREGAGKGKKERREEKKVDKRQRGEEREEQAAKR